MTVESFFILFLCVQIAHSLEELSTGFHAVFPPLKMSFRFFLLFELCFTAFWVSVLFLHTFPARDVWMAGFNVLMFANGVWHVAWFLFTEKGKHYVPGLVTAPIHIGVFLWYYFTLLV